MTQKGKKAPVKKTKKGVIKPQKGGEKKEIVDYELKDKIEKAIDKAFKKDGEKAPQKLEGTVKVQGIELKLAEIMPPVQPVMYSAEYFDKGCNFFVVTYWWGRHPYDAKSKTINETALNFNFNTGRACPDEIIKQFLTPAMQREEYDDVEELKTDMKNIRQKMKPHMNLNMYNPWQMPKTYVQMINDWVKSCESQGCNYLALEVEDFVMPGGYQLAINAKPFFIKRAIDYIKTKLEERYASITEPEKGSLQKRGINDTKAYANQFTGVVYIDGDMTVNQFPAIFNMKNVDYMARGWNIDPRSSINFLRRSPRAIEDELDEDEQLLYRNTCFDPYVFETSGGTMFFGATKTAKTLLEQWEHAAVKYVNAGKADDRIISQLVTMHNWNFPVNIIQLPIEYLWLTDIYEQNLIDALDKMIDYTKNLEVDSNGKFLKVDKPNKLLNARGRELVRHVSVNLDQDKESKKILDVDEATLDQLVSYKSDIISQVKLLNKDEKKIVMDAIRKKMPHRRNPTRW